MRSFLLAFALLAAACTDVATERGAQRADAAADGYAVEIRANPAEQVYLVTAPDGRTVGARAAGGASALMDGEAIRSLSAPPDFAQDEREETVSLRMPGFELSVRGDPDAAGKGDEGGRVSINVGGERFVIDADEGAPGEEDDRANVRISGMSETEVREFIAKADQLSPSVQAQLLAELGLE